jgi:hypothetical protein
MTLDKGFFNRNYPAVQHCMGQSLECFLMGRVRSIVVLVSVFFLSGCLRATTNGPARDAGLIPFRVDPPLEDLNTSCLTGSLNGCEVNTNIEEGIRALTRLHGQQMAEMNGALRDLSLILNRTDTVPMARVTAPKLDTSMWVDPDAKYPAPLELRIQAPRGLLRMGVETISDLDGALGRLESMASRHDADWRSVSYEYPRGLVLPEKISIERDYTQVVVSLRHGKMTFDVPRHLGIEYIHRDVAPWMVHVAHVVTRSGMKYKALGEHRFKVDQALVVVGRGPFVIQEGNAIRGKKVFESKVTPRESCQSLRGELRFVRADKTMPLRAGFIKKSPQGGAR